MIKLLPSNISVTMYQQLYRPVALSALTQRVFNEWKIEIQARRFPKNFIFHFHYGHNLSDVHEKVDAAFLITI